MKFSLKILGFLLGASSLSVFAAEGAGQGRAGESFIPRSPTVRLSLQEAEHMVANHCPGHFGGLKKFNPDLVRQWRIATMGVPLRHALSPQILQPFPLFQTLFDTLLARLQTHAPTPALQALEQQVRAHKICGGAVNLLGDYFAYAATLGAPSAEELDFFTHVIEKAPLSGFGIQFWETYIPALAAGKNPLLQGREPIVVTDLHHEMWHFAEAEVTKTFPIKSIYPLFNQHFGLSFMVGTSLQNVFLVAIPNASLRGHGIRSSPLGFAAHDFAHGEIDPKLRSVIMHVMMRANQYASQGGDAAAFIQWYAPLAVRRYNTLMNGLLTIYQRFLDTLFPTYGQQELAQTMAGFFLASHEYPSFATDIYDTPDFSKIIEKLTERTAEALECGDLESPKDPLRTSALTGRSSLPRAEILRRGLKRLVENSTVQMPQSYYAQYPLPDRTQYIRGMITGASVISSPLFLDVTFQLKTGQVIKQTDVTLYHKWHNMDDALGLLRMAGRPIAKPALVAGDEAASRGIAQRTLRQVQGALQDLVRHFKDRATFFAEYRGAGGESIADQYFRQHRAQEQFVQEEMAQHLRRIQAAQARRDAIFGPVALPAAALVAPVAAPVAPAAAAPVANAELGLHVPVAPANNPL